MDAKIVKLRGRLLAGYEPLNTVAEALGKCPRTLRNWHRVDGFPAVELGGSWYVNLPAARTWLLSRTPGVDARQQDGDDLAA